MDIVGTEMEKVVSVGTYIECNINGDGNFWVGAVVEKIGDEEIIAVGLRAERVYTSAKDHGKHWERLNNEQLKYGSLAKIRTRDGGWELAAVTSIRDNAIMLCPVTKSVKYHLNKSLEGVEWRFPSQPEPNISFIRRGDIWNAFAINKDEVRDYGKIHSVQVGVRPYLVVQANKGCGAPVLSCVPISGAGRKDYPFLQRIMLEKDSIIHYEQPIQIPRENFISRVGKLNKEQMAEMDLRLPVGIGLCDSSILHIKRVAVDDLTRENNILYYHGRIVLKYYVVKFKFSELDILKDLNVQKESLNRMTKIDLGEYLSRLEGLNFLYNYRLPEY